MPSNDKKSKIILNLLTFKKENYMVEKRFGFGYTFNYGNRTAILIVATFLMVSLGLAALVLIRTLT